MVASDESLPVRPVARARRARGQPLVPLPWLKPGIFIGALVLLAPLALTSTTASIRRLGYRRWQRLHQLAYLAGILAVVHFIWRVKIDVSQPLLYAAVLGALLMVRVVAWLWQSSRAARQAS